MAFVNKLENGDVTLYSSSGPRPAGREDLKRYMKEKFRLNLLQAVPDASLYVPDDKCLLELLRSFLEKSPMYTMDINVVLKNFRHAGMSVGRSRLLACVNSRRDSFRVFSSKSDVMIGLTDGDKQ